MLFKRIKQIFCNHDFEKRPIGGFMVVDGWLQQAFVMECKKCGKKYFTPGGRKG